MRIAAITAPPFAGFDMNARTSLDQLVGGRVRSALQAASTQVARLGESSGSERHDSGSCMRFSASVGRVHRSRWARARRLALVAEQQQVRRFVSHGLEMRAERLAQKTIG